MEELDDSRLRALFALADVRLAVLFGSAAAGRLRPDSDIDIGILPASNMTFEGEGRIGIESRVALDANRHAILPDGSDRFLVDLAFLDARARCHGLRALEPLKTVMVENLRSMTTWVVERT